MSRNIKVAAVAVALAGGVYLGSAAPAGASNMGFKLERSFDVVRSGAGTPLQNRYIVSMPLFNGLGDVADPNYAPAGWTSKCVGDTGGPTVGDGVVDSADALCDFYTARTNLAQAGQMSLIYWDSANCVPVTQSISVGFGNKVQFSPPTPFPLVRDVSYTVIVGVPNGATYNPVNRVVIVGSHDPSYTGHQLTASTTCGALAQRLDFINLFYHTMYTHANDLACGLEIVDWVDLTDVAGNPGPDGNPDTCWEDVDGDKRFDVGEPLTGIYDGLHGVAISYWDNTPAENRPVSRTVAPGFPAGRLSWSGPNYDLVPGEGYIVTMTAGHSSVFRQPHY
jgi:hypothetical protein